MTLYKYTVDPWTIWFWPLRVHLYTDCFQPNHTESAGYKTCVYRRSTFHLHQFLSTDWTAELECAQIWNQPPCICQGMTVFTHLTAFPSIDNFKKKKKRPQIIISCLLCNLKCVGKRSLYVCVHREKRPRSI